MTSPSPASPLSAASAATPFGRLPSPRRAPVVGHAVAFRRDPLGFLTRCARELGDATRLRMGPFDVLLLAHPDGVQDVLTTTQHAFRKSPLLQRARVVLGDGLLTSEGTVHRRHRRALNAAFRRDRVDGYAADMVAATDDVISAWTPGRPVNAHAATVRSTVTVAGTTLLDTAVAADVAAVEGALADVLAAYAFATGPLGMLLRDLPVGPMRRLRRGARTLDAVALRVLADGQRAGRSPRGVLGTLAASSGHQPALSQAEVRDEVKTLLLAGHETTANALAFACHLLAHHAREQSLLHAEVDRVLDRRLPTAGDVASLPYARAVLAEVLRLYPPSWTMGRQALESCVVAGVAVPAGTVVLLPQWVLHRDPRWWPDAQVFVPGRWLDPAARPPRFAYFPFGGGTRQCIGEAFAWTEGVLALAIIASRWALAPAPGRPLDLAPLLTLRPADGVWVVPTPRPSRTSP